jgi:hypothetical protein
MRPGRIAIVGTVLAVGLGLSGVGLGAPAMGMTGALHEGAYVATVDAVDDPPP